MSQKPNHKADVLNLPSLEVDRGDEAEQRRRTETETQSRHKLVAAKVQERISPQDRTEQELRQMHDNAINWAKVRQRALGLVFFLLLTYFLSLVFSDLINFLDGGKILLGGIKQIVVMAVMYFCFLKFQASLRPEQIEKLQLWTKRAGTIAWRIVKIYILILVARFVLGF